MQRKIKYPGHLYDSRSVVTKECCFDTPAGNLEGGTYRPNPHDKNSPIFARGALANPYGGAWNERVDETEGQVRWPEAAAKSVEPRKHHEPITKISRMDPFLHREILPKVSAGEGGAKSQRDPWRPAKIGSRADKKRRTPA